MRIQTEISAAYLLLSKEHVHSMKSDHWSQATLMERAQHLRQQATTNNGSAYETLTKYPNHLTMFSFRSNDGGAEVHGTMADILYIVDGDAIVVTGGEVVDPKTTAPDEIRGASVKGGIQQELKTGDFIHIPAGMPHQMLVAEGHSVSYFVIKVSEKP